MSTTFATKLANALASRVNPLAPSEMSITADGATLVVSKDREPSLRVHLGTVLRDEEPTEDDIYSAVYNVIDAIQDVVVEETKKPWPSSANEETRQLLMPLVIRAGKLLRI